jgi:hypothetical protein
MEVKIGEKVYNCDRFGLTELADLQDWMQERKEDRIIARAKKIYPDGLPDKIFDEINQEITIDVLEESLVSDIRAIGYLIFLTIKKTHQSVTFEEISQGIGDMSGALKALDSISPAAPAKKTQKKTRKK